jgi:hypothetical protein
MDQLEVCSEQADQQQIFKQLIDKILSSFDQILEFDPKTGGLKCWAW